MEHYRSNVDWRFLYKHLGDDCRLLDYIKSEIPNLSDIKISLLKKINREMYDLLNIRLLCRIMARIYGLCRLHLLYKKLKGNIHNHSICVYLHTGILNN